MEQRRTLRATPKDSSDSRRSAAAGSTCPRLNGRFDRWAAGTAATPPTARTHADGYSANFVDPSVGKRSTKNLEVKWGIHPAGEQRAEWVTGDQRTTLVLLVQVYFHVKFREGDAALAKQGD